MEQLDEETIARFRRQYYAKRWGGDVSAAVSVEQRKQIVLDYVRGLQFCIDYYFHGCRLWSFFYAHHYAPLLCDMALIAGDNEKDRARIFSFELSAPYKIFEQLLAVLPCVQLCAATRVLRDRGNRRLAHSRLLP